MYDILFSMKSIFTSSLMQSKKQKKNHSFIMAKASYKFKTSNELSLAMNLV